METLPVELVVHILNGHDDRGVALLDPRWRFAVRGVCRAWNEIIGEGATAEQGRAIVRAWEACGGRCECEFEAHGPDHDAHERAVVRGRIVAARCVLGWGGQGTVDDGLDWLIRRAGAAPVPPQDRCACALVAARDQAEAARVLDAARATLMEPDPLVGRALSRPVRRDRGGLIWTHDEDMNEEDEATRSTHDGGMGLAHDLWAIAASHGHVDAVRALADRMPFGGHHYGTAVLYASMDARPDVVEYVLGVWYERGDREALRRAGEDGEVGVWQAAAGHGSAVVERLLDMCARDDAPEGAAARLCRPPDDAEWQCQSFSWSDTTDVLDMCQRRGVAIDHRALLEHAARNRGCPRVVRWLIDALTRAPRDGDGTGTISEEDRGARLAPLCGALDAFMSDRADAPATEWTTCCLVARDPSGRPTYLIDDDGVAPYDDNAGPDDHDVRGIATLRLLCEAAERVATPDALVARWRTWFATARSDSLTGLPDALVAVMWRWRRRVVPALSVGDAADLVEMLIGHACLRTVDTALAAIEQQGALRLFEPCDGWVRAVRAAARLYAARGDRRARDRADAVFGLIATAGALHETGEPLPGGVATVDAWHRAFCVRPVDGALFPRAPGGGRLRCDLVDWLVERRLIRE
jgi:hypothetical protein